MSRYLIDTHFHLDFYQNHQALYSLINELEQYTLCMTNTPGVFLACRQLYSETKYIKFALGFHPQDGQLNYKDFEDFMQLFSEAHYIGEVGMDFSTNSYMAKSLQLEVFEKIVNACSTENKLFSVHLKKCEKEAVSILNRYKPKKCIVHWFSGSQAYFKELVDLGCFFSINNNMIMNNKLQDTLKLLPKEKILVESDGPFSKINGMKYSPEMLLAVYQNLASFFDDQFFVERVYHNFRTILLQ